LRDLIGIVVLVLALSFVYGLAAYSRKKDMECPYCLESKEDYAPCGNGFCKECCRKCHERKENCRHILSCLEEEQNEKFKITKP
jgi:hypothetical protein